MDVLCQHGFAAAADISGQDVRNRRRHPCSGRRLDEGPFELLVFVCGFFFVLYGIGAEGIRQVEEQYDSQASVGGAFVDLCGPSDCGRK